jgi:hypothetical protein
MEVVLPNGEMMNPEFAGLPAARAGKVYRWGAGPSLDGSFRNRTSGSSLKEKNA